MGRVHIDIEKKEREFKTMTLSDENVIEYLILYRDKVDPHYGVDISTDIFEAGDTFDFNRELIALYITLDEIIEKCGFNEKELMFLRYLFEGYTIYEVAEEYKLYSVMTAYRVFDRIVKRISEVNYQEWKKWLNNNVLKDE